MIDLSNPKHQEVLSDACQGFVDLGAAFMQRQATQCERHGFGTHPMTLAIRALSSPAESAAIVRALLEGRGVEVAEHGANRGTPDFPYVSIVYGYAFGEPGIRYVSFAQAKAPTIVLCLLSATTREEALLALRGSNA